MHALYQVTPPNRENTPSKLPQTQSRPEDSPALPNHPEKWQGKKTNDPAIFSSEALSCPPARKLPPCLENMTNFHQSLAFSEFGNWAFPSPKKFALLPWANTCAF